MNRNCESLLLNLASPSAQLVTGFYSNIHDISDSKQFSVVIRGQIFRISHDLLSNLLSFSRVENPLYPYSAKTGPNLDTLTSFLAKKPHLLMVKDSQQLTSLLKSCCSVGLLEPISYLLRSYLHYHLIELNAFIHNGSVICFPMIKYFHSHKSSLISAICVCHSKIDHLA